MKQEQGFIFISMALLALVMSILVLASFMQSRLASHFVANLLSDSKSQEQSRIILHQAESVLAKSHNAVSIDYQINTIASVPNSLNYGDHGGAIVREITLNPSQAQAIWWQRQADYSQEVMSFLAKDGRIYHILVSNNPALIQFDSGGFHKVLQLPAQVSELGLPLLINRLNASYAEELYIADNRNTIWKIDLQSESSHWQLVQVLHTSAPIILTVGLWAGSTYSDAVILYIATRTGIEAWQLNHIAKLIWKVPNVAANLFLEGPRLWWVAKSGEGHLMLGAVNRFSGVTISPPVFVAAPDQTKLVITTHSKNYQWQMEPDNLRQIEVLTIGGAKVPIYPPRYQSGQQSFKGGA